MAMVMETESGDGLVTTAQLPQRTQMAGNLTAAQRAVREICLLGMQYDNREFNEELILLMLLAKDIYSFVSVVTFTLSLEPGTIFPSESKSILSWWYAV